MTLLELKLAMVENIKSILKGFDSPSVALHDQLLEELERVQIDVYLLQRL